jgi:hypothetical protein
LTSTAAKPPAGAEAWEDSTSAIAKVSTHPRHAAGALPSSTRRGRRGGLQAGVGRALLGEELGSKSGCVWVASLCRDLQPSATCAYEFARIPKDSEPCGRFVISRSPVQVGSRAPHLQRSISCGCSLRGCAGSGCGWVAGWTIVELRTPVSRKLPDRYRRVGCSAFSRGRSHLGIRKPRTAAFRTARRQRPSPLDTCRPTGAAARRGQEISQHIVPELCHLDRRVGRCPLVVLAHQSTKALANLSVGFTAPAPCSSMSDREEGRPSPGLPSDGATFTSTRSRSLSLSCAPASSVPADWRLRRVGAPGPSDT